LAASAREYSEEGADANAFGRRQTLSEELLLSITPHIMDNVHRIGMLETKVARDTVRLVQLCAALALPGDIPAAALRILLK